MTAVSDVYGSPHELDQTMLERLVARMCSRYDVAAADVRRHTEEALAEFDDARLRAFVPVLVEKQLRERLRRQSTVGQNT